jgi:hypothetical protein
MRGYGGNLLIYITFLEIKKPAPKWYRLSEL